MQPKYTDCAFIFWDKYIRSINEIHILITRYIPIDFRIMVRLPQTVLPLNFKKFINVESPSHLNTVLICLFFTEDEMANDSAEFTSFYALKMIGSKIMT